LCPLNSRASILCLQCYIALILCPLYCTASIHRPRCYTALILCRWYFTDPILCFWCYAAPTLCPWHDILFVFYGSECTAPVLSSELRSHAIKNPGSSYSILLGFFLCMKSPRYVCTNIMHRPTFFLLLSDCMHDHQSHPSTPLHTYSFVIRQTVVLIYSCLQVCKFRFFCLSPFFPFFRLLSISFQWMPFFLYFFLPFFPFLVLSVPLNSTSLYVDAVVTGAVVVFIIIIIIIIIINLTKIYWLLGRKSKFSTSNKLLMYMKI
jgi:hypothetical protein